MKAVDRDAAPLRALVLLGLVVVAGCGAPVAPAVAVGVALDPLVLEGDAALRANVTVENAHDVPVTIRAGCSPLATVVVLRPDGSLLSVSPDPEACAGMPEPANVVGARQAVGRDVTYPAAFWKNHPEAGPGRYTVRAWTEWRTGEDRPWTRAEGEAAFERR